MHDVYFCLCNDRAQFLASNRRVTSGIEGFNSVSCMSSKPRPTPLTTSGTLALLAIHLCPVLVFCRAIEFIQEFVAEVAGGEHSLDIAAGKAYTKCLRRYHNWIVRGMFSVSGISLVVYVQVLIRSYECCRNGGVYTHVMFTSFLLLPTVLFIGCNVIVCFLPQYPYARALVRFPTHPSQMPTQNVCIYLPLSKILL